jgi:hypothetical protein
LVTYFQALCLPQWLTQAQAKAAKVIFIEETDDAADEVDTFLSVVNTNADLVLILKPFLLIVSLNHINDKSYFLRIYV